MAGAIAAGVLLAGAIAAFAWVVLGTTDPIPVAKLPKTPGYLRPDAAGFRKRMLDAAAALERETDTADGIKVATFLGNESRRFYGRGPVPERLKLIWRTKIGCGKTSGTAKSRGPVLWCGTGWTGQPALVRDKGRNYLLIGGFDHGLRKVDAANGRVLWRYEFDDVIKGSPTIFSDPDAKDPDARLVVVVGSRRGFGTSLGSEVAPLRGISFKTGRELWRVKVPRTRSYSQDSDGSPLQIGRYLFAPVESGYLLKLDPSRTSSLGDRRSPRIGGKVLCYERSDPDTHGGNLVLEGSPARSGDRVYIAAGSGHVYGIRVRDMKKVWDFKTGSDLDSTVAVNKEGRLLVGIEKQYVPQGGAIMLDPAKRGSKAVVWFFPTGNRKFQDWEGGVIGSVAINDEYNEDGHRPALAAFNAIDGKMYVVAQDALASKRVAGPSGTGRYRTPVKVFSDAIGGAISTPIIVDDHIVAAGYDARVHVYRISYGKPGKGVTLPRRDGTGKVGVRIKEVASYAAGTFESTPIVWKGRIFIGSRNGSFYCLGKK